MANLLQQLENNEGILLMYLADELESEDRAEVEQLLAADGGLRDELERLRQTQQAVWSVMGELEKTGSSKSREDAAVRQIGRLIRQWQVLHRPAEQSKVHRIQNRLRRHCRTGRCR